MTGERLMEMAEELRALAAEVEVNAKTQEQWDAVIQMKQAADLAESAQMWLDRHEARYAS